MGALIYYPSKSFQQERTLLHPNRILHPCYDNTTLIIQSWTNAIKLDCIFKTVKSTKLSESYYNRLCNSNSVKLGMIGSYVRNQLENTAGNSILTGVWKASKLVNSLSEILGGTAEVEKHYDFRPFPK